MSLLAAAAIAVAEGTEISFEETDRRSDGAPVRIKRESTRIGLAIPGGKMARPERFELPTSWFVAMRSIQLSYGRLRCFDVRLDSLDRARAGCLVGLSDLI